MANHCIATVYLFCRELLDSLCRSGAAGARRISGVLIRNDIMGSRPATVDHRRYEGKPLVQAVDHAVDNLRVRLVGTQPAPEPGRAAMVDTIEGPDAAMKPRRSHQGGLK